MRPPRQTYKALLWDYDAILEASEQECSYCLTQREIALLLPVLDYIGWTTRYTSTIDTDPDQELIDQWQGELARKLMSGCCDNFTNTRYSVTGIFEVSEDGGATWTERRDLDPRFNAPTLPPLTSPEGEDRRCEAANRVTGFMQSQADDLIAESAAWASLTGVIAVLVAILFITLAITSGGTLTPLLLGLSAALLTTGSAAFDAAMTTTVYDTLTCIVYCHTPDDGAYTEADWQAIKAQIFSDLTGIAATFLHDSINAIGLVGMTNVSRSGNNYGFDCAGCDCEDTWCYLFNFATGGAQDWAKVTTSGYNNGVIVGVPGWSYEDTVNTALAPDAANRLAYIRRLMASTTLTRMVMTYDFTGGTYDNSGLRALFFHVNGADVANLTRAEMVDGNDQTFEWTGSIGGVTNVEAWLRSSRDISSPYTYSGSLLIKSIRMEGLGNNPFGLDNCP